jgi:hypothetical protein
MNKNSFISDLTEAMGLNKIKKQLKSEFKEALDIAGFLGLDVEKPKSKPKKSKPKPKAKKTKVKRKPNSKLKK